MNSVTYIDKINFLSTILLLKKHPTKLYVLDELKNNIYFKILKIRGYKIVEKKFIAGELLTDKGENILHASRRESGKLALEISENIVDKNKKLNYLNSTYGNNTIKLFLAKHLQVKLEYWLLRIMAVKALTSTKSKNINSLILVKPSIFDTSYIYNLFEDVNIVFYNNFFKKIFNLIYFLIRSFYKELKLNYHNIKYKHFQNIENKDPSILSLNEDSIRFEQNLRSHLFWIDNNIKSMNQKHFILNFSLPKWFLKFMKIDKKEYQKDFERLSKIGINNIEPFFFKKALLYAQKNKHIISLKSEINLLFNIFLADKNLVNKYYYLLIYDLFKESIKISSLSLYLNIKVYLFKETHSIYSDAIQLISSNIGLKTIGIQYSNMPILNPVMMTTCDEFISFSKMYRKVFSNKAISPKKFIFNGYLYNGISDYVKKDALDLKKQIENLGVNFIVTYFDESIQKGKWAGISSESHLYDIHQVAKKVIDDKSIAVIIKSQFVFNSPSKLYPNDKIINKAKSTGRYIELVKGQVRNDVYPTEPGLISNICISHKLGATAGLEVATLGKRVILIDSNKTSTRWDKLYEKADIIYPNIDEVIKAIDIFRNNNIKNNELGCWKKIINNFDPFLDGNAIKRLREHLHISMSAT